MSLVRLSDLSWKNRSSWPVSAKRLFSKPVGRSSVAKVKICFPGIDFFVPFGLSVMDYSDYIPWPLDVDIYFYPKKFSKGIFPGLSKKSVLAYRNIYVVRLRF